MALASAVAYEALALASAVAYEATVCYRAPQAKRGFTCQRMFFEHGFLSVKLAYTPEFLLCPRVVEPCKRPFLKSDRWVTKCKIQHYKFSASFLVFIFFNQAATLSHKTRLISLEKKIDSFIQSNGSCPVASKAFYPRTYDWSQPTPFGLAKGDWTAAEGRYVVDRYIKCYYFGGGQNPMNGYNLDDGILRNALNLYMDSVVSSLVQHDRVNKNREQVLQREQQREQAQVRAEAQADEKIATFTQLKDQGKASNTDLQNLRQALTEKRSFIQERKVFVQRSYRGEARYDLLHSIDAELAAINAKLAPFEEQDRKRLEARKSLRLIEDAKHKIDWCSSDKIGLLSRQVYDDFLPIFLRIEQNYQKLAPDMTASEMNDLMVDSEKAANDQAAEFDAFLKKADDANYMMSGNRGSVSVQDFPQVGAECRMAEVGLRSAFQKNR